MDEDEITRERDTLQYFSEVVVPEEMVEAVDGDPGDDIFLEVALASDADYVVSGDSHLLDLGEFRGFRFCQPTSCLMFSSRRSSDAEPAAVDRVGVSRAVAAGG